MQEKKTCLLVRKCERASETSTMHQATLKEKL